MTADVKELEARVRVLEGEVDGEKMVTEPDKAPLPAGPGPGADSGG
jgi:hypothetical protein